MDCHDLRSRNDDKGKDGNGIFLWIPDYCFREWQKLCNINAVTANPLGCGSLWNNKQQQRQRLDCHDLRSRNDKKVENGFIFLWIATKILRIFTERRQRQRQTATAKTAKQRIICFLYYLSLFVVTFFVLFHFFFLH